MKDIFNIIKGVFFLLLGGLSVLIAVFIIGLNYFYSETTATITSVDYQGMRRCPISRVAFEASDGEKVIAYISGEQSCTDMQHPQVGESVQIVYHPWLRLSFPTVSLKSDIGANSDSLDPLTAWFGAASAAIFGLTLILASLGHIFTWFRDRRKK